MYAKFTWGAMFREKSKLSYNCFTFVGIGR